jgi:hypothetical protein
VRSEAKNKPVPTRGDASIVRYDIRSRDKFLEYPRRIGSPVRLVAHPPDSADARFTRGRRRPRAISWYGFSAFWGHLRHLVASAIATENIDSRQWMIPDSPDALLGRMLDLLRWRGAKPAASLVEGLGGEAWLDFVSDTGDDVSVSEEVARMVASTYEVADPDDASGTITLPRGDVLMLGGDLAYPVATVREITRRLVDPWNRVFEPELDAAEPRVLMGVPGNHDWYDGLDGFARLCQAHCDFEEQATPSDALHPDAGEHPVLAWAEAFARGELVRKPGSVALAGYTPVQRASYFRVRLTPDLDFWGVDRQLKSIDPRQRAYFASAPPARGRLVVFPDPARAWGEVRKHGAASLESLGIRPGKMPTLLLAGDVHHYERSREGPSLHVVAGGGGAFLHGARVAKNAAYEIEREFPNAKASKRLLALLPWHVAAGSAGWVLTVLLAIATGAALLAEFRSRLASSGVAITTSIVIAIATLLLIGWRNHRAWRVIPFAVALGLAIGALPVAIGVGADGLAERVLGGAAWARASAFLIGWALATYTSGWAFGAMLQAIARLGLNHAQPYAALGIPGFKHFVRMRIRYDQERGSVIDAFVVGKVDPLGKSPPVLVDQFRWRPAEPP